MTAWTLVFHVLGLLFWIGGLLIATSVLVQHTKESSSEAREALGRVEAKLMRSMANPGAIVSILSGIILIATNPSYYLHANWLQAKLVLVLILLGLHWVVQTRAKSFRAGKILLGRRDWLTLHIAIALTFLGILILALPGEVFWK